MSTVVQQIHNDYTMYSIYLQFAPGPAKTGHVGTNYIPSLYKLYLRTGTKYLYSYFHHKAN